MKFSDIVALAKMGYKPDDIRELMTLKEETPEPENKPAPEEKPAPVTEPEPEPTPEGDEKPGPASQGSDDKIKELEEQIKGLQAANQNRTRPEPEKGKSDEEILQDLARHFM